MKRAELKQILEKISPESRRFYRLSPTLYRDLVLWEDYLQCIELNLQKKYRAVKNYARYEICSQYSISEKTFYSIRDVLSFLCDDVN